MRKTWTLLFIVGGFAIQALSFFYLAAPLGTPVSESFANPRVPFAAVVFLLGVMMVFGSAVVHELYPGPRE